MAARHRIEATSIPAWLVLFASSTVALAQSVPGTSNQPSQNQNQIQTVQLEEVVVTASKRSGETVQNVPGGITALTGDTLQNLAVRDFQDYMPYVPGLSANQSVGIPGQYTVILRGLNSGSVQTTPTVGYYIDETPITPNSANSAFGTFSPDPDLGDVERIEVLKGPQATLYGASTLGGLIKIVTRKPDLENFGSDVSFGGSTLTDGGSGYVARGTVNLPLINDALAVRLSGFDREDPGYTDNVLTGDRDINSVRAQGGKLTLRYDPVDKLDIQLSALVQESHSVGSALEFLDPKTLSPIYGVDKYSQFYNTRTDTQLNLFSLDANYDTGIGTLTNATGFTRYAAEYNHEDDTQAYAPLLPLFGLTSPPIALRGDGFVPEVKKLAEELRFTSIRMANFVWQLGFYYTDEKVYYPGGTFVTLYPSGALLPGPLNPFFFGEINGKYKEYAGFGDLTYYLTDSLDATVGMRYSHNDQTGEVLESGALVGPPSDIVRNLSASDNSYLFDLRWRPTPDLSTYLRAASAYRPGGVQVNISTLTNAQSTFGPDTDWDYEGGIKGRWFDGRLDTNVDVYYIDWRNIQLNTTSGSLLLTGNGGNAKSEGVEFDSTYQVIQGLTIGANASYDEAQMTSVNPKNTAGARVGDPLPYTPKWSGSLTGDYLFPVTKEVQAGVGASWLYHGWSYNSFSADQLNTRVTLPSYSLFSLRGHLDWSQFKLVLDIDNVANKQTFTNVLFDRIFPNQPGPAWATPVQPRLYRLTLSMHF